MATTAAPEAVGLSSARLEAAASVYESAIGAPDGVSAASMVVLRRGQVVLARGFGRVAPQPEAPAVEPSSVFMLASITKPVTAMALLLLVEEGRLSLEDPACLHLPEFSEGERASITVRDLLAHTSGLPDMLPENMALREARAPLSDFVAQTLTTPLLFTPGTDFSYQSMGILLAATIVERLTGQPMRDFMCGPAPLITTRYPTSPHPTLFPHPTPTTCLLTADWLADGRRDRIFTPLGMHNSELGLGPNVAIDDCVWIGTRPDGASDGPPDLPNTRYWRDMGTHHENF
eukprot:COSAG04_NODE_3423_length_2824_cov_2.216514_3_plen_289_part_00